MMRQAFRHILAAACCIGILGLSPAVQAQGTAFGLGAAKIPDAGKSADRTQGLRFGQSVFHAGLALELGWDSNPLYASNKDTSSAYLRLTPQLSLGTKKTGEDKLPFVVYNLSLGLDYVGYLQELSSSSSKDRHMVGATAGAGLEFNPQGILRFALMETFTRTNEPRAGVDYGYNRDYNVLGFDMTWNPGKGFIDVLLGYRFILDFFEDPSGDTSANELAAFNAMRHEVKLKVAWRFFPKTAFWAQIDTGYLDYMRDFNEVSLGTMAAGNRSSTPLRAMVGVTGRLTPFLIADVGIGYRGFFYSEKLENEFPGADFVEDAHHDVAAHVSTTWQIAPTVGLRLGYQHDSHDSLVGDYYKADSVHFATLMEFFDRRLQLKAGIAWSLINYKGLFYTDTTGDGCTVVSGNISSCERKDNYLIVDIGATYYFLNWLSVGLGYQMLGNFTDFETVYTGAGEPRVQQPSFSKHRVFGLVQVYY
ncbi:MAG: hypothetical protein RBU30_03545 [Polyangia bacterium]|jgi:hypothetical protein|nr:hypothetical protein [Polyangia bacterium]